MTGLSARTTKGIVDAHGRRLVARVLGAQRREIRDPLFDGLGDVGTVALGDLSARIINLLEQLRPYGDH